MSKIFVLDTNVLLHDPKALFAFDDNETVVPLVVLDELDKKKNGPDEVARHARMVIRALDEMREQGNLHEGVKTSRGGIVRVEINHKDNVPKHLDPFRADNRIISVTLGLQSMHPDSKVSLITKDINMRVKCDALNVAAEDYNTDSVAENAESLYSGCTSVNVLDPQINAFHNLGFLDQGVIHKFHENQYVLLRSDTNPKHSGLARFSNKQLVKIEPRSNIWGISPRNKEQAFAFDALFNPDIRLITMTGKAGTGKTILAAAAGVSQVYDTSTYRKIIMSRPIMPLGRDIGFLPGTKEEKMQPWMAPLQDNLELLFSERGADYLDLEQAKGGKLQIEAITYIRGRSIPKTFIIIDECQNLTRHEIKTIITRVGEDSKVVLTGDIHQIDNPFIDALDNGLSYVIEKFKDESIAAHISLKKGERSDLASKAAELL